MRARPWLVVRVIRARAMAGFTMIELALVLVLLAIVAKIAIPQAFNSDALTLRAQARNFTAYLQRAQLLAITQGVGVGVFIANDLKSYTIQANMANMPNQVVDLVNGAAFTSGAGVTYTFDSLGQPATNTTWNFGLQAAGVPATNVTVEAVSGLIKGP